MPRTKRRKNSVSGYFRQVFQERPELLHTKSNDELRARWLRDHPGNKEVPKSIVQNLANLKSILRKKSREGDGKGRAVLRASGPFSPGGRGMEALEEYIDECLTLAKNVDRGGLENVIKLLRRARNEVVWKMGQ